MNKTWFGVYSIIHSWKKGDDKRLLEMAKSLSENFNMDVTIFGFYPYKDTSPDTLEHGLYTYSEEGYVKKYIAKCKTAAIKQTLRLMVENSDKNRERIFIVPFCFLSTMVILLSSINSQKTIALITTDINIGNPILPNPAIHYQRQTVISELGKVVKEIQINQGKESQSAYLMVITKRILSDIKKYKTDYEKWESSDIAVCFSNMQEPFKSIALALYTATWLPGSIDKLFEDRDE